MAPSNQDDFDGYRKWLGITNKKRLPTHYEVLAISLDEDDPEVIRAAAEQRCHYVESKRGEGHDAIVTEVIYRINEAESTLLNDEMRRDYDRQLNLFQKRHKDRQVDPLAPRSRIKSQPGRTVGEDSGIVKTFVGIMAVVCVGFGIMAWFSFQLPWAKKPAQQAEAVPVAQGPAPAPTQVAQVPAPVAAQVEAPEPKAMPERTSDDVVLTDENFLIDWEPTPATGQSQWSITNGILKLNASGPSLVTKRKFSDFDLHLEFKLPSKCNTGVYLRGKYEVQLLDSDFRTQTGQPAPPTARCGAIYNQVAPSKDVYRGSDQWNTLDVRLVGRVVTVRMNDAIMIESHTLTGVTSGAEDKNEFGSGPIVLQAHTVPGQEFRNIRITPIHDTVTIPFAAPVKPVASPKSPDPHRLLSGHTADVNLLAISSDGKFIASASHDHTVRLWEFETGKQVWRTAWGNTIFKALAFEANGKRLWAANENGACSIESESGAAKDVLEFKSCGPAAFGKNCSLLSIACDGKMRLFDTSRKKQIKIQDGWISELAFNRDATILAFGGYEDQGDIRLYRPAENKINGAFVGLNDRTFALKISPDDKYVAATSGCGKNKQVAPSNKIIVWEAATGRTVMEHPHADGWCYGLAFSMDSRLLAAGGSGRDSDWQGASSPNKNKVRVWRINDGKELHAFTGHTAAIQSLVFTPEANSIVSSGVDHTIRIWPLNASRTSPDRDVAEWVLGKGGKVSVSTNGAESVEIQSKDQLPSGEFILVKINLFNVKEIVDQDLRRLAGVKSLAVLTLMGTSVTDSGLNELADLTKLQSLNVAGTTVNGSGFQHLGKLGKLEVLLCGGAPINDAALVHLKKLPSLKMLGLIDTRVTDTGMSALGSLSALVELRLTGAKLTDKGLNSLKNLKSLEKLSIERTNVTQKGVTAFQTALPKCEVKAD